MNRRLLFLLITCFYRTSALAMEDTKKVAKNSESIYVYRKAQHKDLTTLLELINTEAAHESKKLVILPKKFRECALKSAIEKKCIFIAEDNGKIIGYKKLFLINDESEKQELLNDEIRCINNEQNCTFAGYITHDDTLIADASILSNKYYSTCIYNGGDFTVASYRGKGINQQLTHFALFSLLPTIKQRIQDHRNSVALVYGVTQANAGEYPGAFSDRTLAISKSFKVFIQALENHKNPIELCHRRYRAFMPTFDPESSVLRPLPDDQSVPGFGCVLVYNRKESHE